MNCKSSTSNPIEVSFGAKSQFGAYLIREREREREREEVEFPLINGSGGFNLSMETSEVHHTVDVYVRVS